MVPAERKPSSGHLRNTTTVGLLGPEPQTQTHTHAHTHTRAQSLPYTNPIGRNETTVGALQLRGGLEADQGERKCRDTFDKESFGCRRRRSDPSVNTATR